MDYQQIIETLKEQGKITDEDIKNAISDEEEKIRTFATLLHSIICSAHHTSTEEYVLGMEGCGFYAEETLENMWELAVHKKWLCAIKDMIDFIPGIMERTDEVIEVCNAIVTRENNYIMFDKIYIALSKAGITKQEY